MWSHAVWLPSVVKLLGLVRVPALIGLLYPLGSTQKVTGPVSWLLSNLKGQILDYIDGQENLEPVFMKKICKSRLSDVYLLQEKVWKTLLVISVLKESS